MNQRKCVFFLVSIFAVICVSGCATMQSKYDFIKAGVALNAENYAEAATLLQSYLLESPDDEFARNRLGFALMNLNRYDQAIEQFNRVLQQTPKDPYATLYLGLTYVKQDNLQAATNIWQQYRNPQAPLVEAQIKKELTLLMIAHNQRQARQAIAAEQQLTESEPDPQTIAVFNYADLSPNKDLRAFQKGLAAIVITDLSKIKSINVVERLRLQTLLDEIKLGQSGVVDPATAPRVGKLLGAGSLTVGNLAQGIQTTTSMVNTNQRDIAGTAICSASPADFFNLPPCIVREIARIRGINLGPTQIQDCCAPHTKNYQAFIYFGRGIDAFDASRWKDARQFFAKALKEDPKFDLAREYHDSNPADNALSMAQLSKISPTALAANVEQSIDQSMAEQDAADQAAREKEIEEGGAEGGGGGDGCFAYNMQVLMADQSLKRIIDLRPGDLVQSREIDTGQLVARPVVRTYYSDQDHYYLINGYLKITASHPVYAATGEWKKVGDLKAGDVISGMDRPIRVDTITRVPYQQRVYNFKVADSHNYFVTADSQPPYLVHNHK